MLRLYCHALTERSVDLQDLKQLVEKNIGWSKSDVATSDGAAIFLPSVVERFDLESDNFDFLKVMLTQQAGHIEFGPSSKLRRRNPNSTSRSFQARKQSGSSAQCWQFLLKLERAYNFSRKRNEPSAAESQSNERRGKSRLTTKGT
jgi:hypothetical protein